VSLLALLVAMAAFTAGCGGGSDGETVSPAVARAQRLLDETTFLQGVKSGYLDSSVFVDNETKQVAVQWGAEGPFKRAGNTLEANARWEFAGLDGLRLGKLLVLGEPTILSSGGESYRITGAPSERTSQASTNCQQLLEGIDVDSLLKNLSTKPEPVGETTVEAELRLHAFLATVSRLTAPSACGALLEAIGISPQSVSALEAQVEATFKKSEVSLIFNKDHVLTGVSIGIWVESPPPKPEEIDGTLTVSLSRINEGEAIAGSPSTEALEAKAGKASPVQRTAVEDWIGLVNAAFASVAGS